MNLMEILNLVTEHQAKITLFLNNIDNIIKAAIGVAALVIVLLILNIISLVKISRLKKRLNKFTQKGDEFDIEKMLAQYIDRSNVIDGKYDEVLYQIKDINSRLRFAVSRLGLVRYNHFEDVGGDLCFALALLDENSSGVVINTIFSREGSYIYAKPVFEGESSNPLSDEEKKSIEVALRR
ncbi:hypothetical protein AGMMS49975_05260 [Clostridia bacterium]|nr:hypothetical protein AGMMS49975_05260 [Clostridia bacterium]GHU74842.1 hypothetical protein FACS1894188_04380 [Clostridia bacterium]